MEISSKYRLEKLIDKNETREACRYIHIGKNTATAYNGRAVAIVPCAVGAGDHPGAVTLDSLMHARSLSSQVATLHLRDDKTVVATDTTEFPRSLHATAQHKAEQLELVRQSIDEVQKVASLTSSVVPKRQDDDLTLSVDIGILSALAQALGKKDDIITLRFRAPNAAAVESPIRIEGLEGAVGVLMPCKP